jgi:hypothetical protein
MLKTKLRPKPQLTNEQIADKMIKIMTAHGLEPVEMVTVIRRAKMIYKKLFKAPLK